MASPSEVAIDEQPTATGAGRTDVGRRRDHNEDQILISPELGLYAVADGMGGHQAGDVASSIAAAALEEFFWEEQDLGDGIDGLDGLSKGAARLVKAVHHCNREVFSRSGRSANQGGMGSTVVALHVDEEENVVHIVHVGDSRCYRIRHGQIEQITKDHSMINEALRLNPDLSDEILKQLPSNVVTRALGTKENVQPDVCSEPLCRDDIYLLCSDGLNGEVADEDMLFGVLESEDLAEGCELLVAMANEAGGRDNVSAVLVRVDKGKTAPPIGEDDGEVEVAVGDEELSDADLDAWLGEPSDPGSDADEDGADEDDDGEVEIGEDVVFSEAPPDEDDDESYEDDDESYDEDEDEAYDEDAFDEVDEHHDFSGDDDEDEEDEEDADEEVGTEDEAAAEVPAEREPESLSALAPPFGNEPPRLRRPSSVPPEASDEDEEDPSEIAALPVMGIGEMEPAPPSRGALIPRCHHCGHKLLPDERFCGMCGSRTLEEGEVDPTVPCCDACGTQIVDDTRFCVECGVRL